MVFKVVANRGPKDIGRKTRRKKYKNFKHYYKICFIMIDNMFHWNVVEIQKFDTLETRMTWVRIRFTDQKE